MLLGLAIGIGIPVVLIGLYAWGRWMYGDQWYVAFGRNVARGDDDLTDEIERAQFTSLNIAQPNDLKR
jgi:hypothetical protein